MKWILTFLFLTVLPCLSLADDLGVFLEQPKMHQVKISPDGRHLAAIQTEENSDSIVIIKTENNKRRTIFNGEDAYKKELNIGRIYWIDNRYIGVSLSEKILGVQDILDTKIKRQFLILDTTAEDTNVFSVRSKGWFAHPAHGEKSHFLYAKSAKNSKLYKIDVTKLNHQDATLGKLDKIDGGQFVSKNAVKSIEGYVLKWFFDQQDNVVSALLYTQEGDLELHEFLEDGEVEVLFSWSQENKKSKKHKKNTPELANSKLEKYNPIAIAQGNGIYYAFSSEEQTKRNIYKVNYLAKEVEKVFTTKAYEISTVYVDSSNNLIGARVNRDGYYIDEISSIDDDTHRQSGFLETIIDESEDGNSILYYYSRHNQPGQLDFKDLKTNKSFAVFKSLPNINRPLPSVQIEKTIQVSDASIPYILNLPDQVAPSPLIVLPHGGPIGVHDSPYFDREVQLLVSQGFGVLRVNFRGSSGYSLEYEKLGRKQWGSKMLDDIMTALNQVTERPDIRADKVCIYGASYGGYVAAELLTRHPDKFKCAVSQAGVYDLPLHLRTKMSNKEIHKWTKDNIGDVSLEYEELKSISPLYRSTDLDRPIMLVHGGKDLVVDQEQFYRYKLALELHNKQVAFVFEPEMGHSYRDMETTVRVMDKTLKFLRRHLKGDSSASL